MPATAALPGTITAVADILIVEDEDGLLQTLRYKPRARWPGGAAVHESRPRP
jgi:hypothetical protein